MRRPPLLTPLLLAAAALLCAACAGSSGSSQTKPTRTILTTEYDDARVGAEASQTIQQEMGVLDDPELNAYVNRIGRKLLRGIPRRSFSFEFYVVDQEEPNAFALPGGYIFISRGLLTLANDEDELANVIGHEITHSALRHAAAQQEIARRGSAIVSPFAHATNLAAYGRDMERTADRGG